MKPKTKLIATLAAIALPLLTLLQPGCESDSGHAVKFDASGKYVALSGKALLDPANTGARISAFTLTQHDDHTLTVTDSNGNVYTGKVSGKTDTALHFKARGTVNGVDVEIKGTLDILDGTIYISGTYKEKNGVTAALHGKLAGAAKKTAAEPAIVYPAVAINGAGAIEAGDSASYSASGGSGEYVWVYSHSGSTTFDSSGNSATITVPAGYPNTSTTLTVTDKNDASNTVTITIAIGSDPGRA